MHRDNDAIGKELDIFIPKYKFAIEYGAWYWHKNRAENDRIKQLLCKENGIKLITKEFQDANINDLRGLSDDIKANHKGIAMVFAAVNGDKATFMVSLTDDVVEKGYAEVSGSSSRYRKKYFLTDEGREIACEIRKTILDINSFVSTDIPQEDIDKFYATFNIICENLNKAEKIF